MAVKLSVCIPTYNQTEFLRKTLQSLLEQHYRDFEIIISDDSSTNVVHDLVQEMLSNSHLTVRYHKNEKALGSPANWNKSVSLASGEWIKFLHHDDWLADAHSLQTWVSVAEQHPEADVLFCVSSILNVAEQRYTENRPDDDFLKALRHSPTVLFNNNRIGSPSATMFRIRSFVPFDTHLTYLVDVDFYMALLSNNPRFVFIPEALIVNTSNHPGQVTSASINKLTQVGEYCYLYNKVFKGATPDASYRRFFKDLFAWYQLKNFKELETAGYPRPQPTFVFNWLLWRANRRW